MKCQKTKIKQRTAKLWKLSNLNDSESENYPYSMNWVAVSTYMFLVISSYFSNKYVLSTLGFRFPMVFQGWQTLVGFLILKLLAYVPSTTNPTLAGGSKLHFLILKSAIPMLVWFLIAKILVIDLWRGASPTSKGSLISKGKSDIKMGKSDIKNFAWIQVKMIWGGFKPQIIAKYSKI